jgi:hypothetical protein
MKLIGSGVGRRNKYDKWVDALGARDLIDAGMNKVQLLSVVWVLDEEINITNGWMPLVLVI